MQFQQNISLQKFNTFKIDVKADYVFVITSEDELLQLVKDPVFLKNNRLIIGGGSNILFTEDFKGLVIKNELKGKNIIKETENKIWINIKSGEVWHDFVMWAVQHNYSGIENLALIPGTIGAAPIQNIGAYGVEAKDIIEKVGFFNFDTQQFSELTANECNFGYRESIFKKELKNKIFVTDVTFCLNKKTNTYKTDYGSINDEIKKRNVQNLTANIVAEIVMDIRKSKLPNPDITGNAGSFFKNPEVTKEKYLEIKNINPNAVGYALENGNYKLAAGWLIESCGLKGFEIHGAAVHDKQALVLINKNNTTGKDVLLLSQHIQKVVFEKYGVSLEPEVNII